MNNNYLILRHGRSEANDKKIIISRPADGLKVYGLTTKGRQQVESSIKSAKAKSWINDKAIIYSSDFKRCLETAEIAKTILGGNNIHTSTELRERYFGDFDRKSVRNLARVFINDMRGHQATYNGVESVDSVIERTTKLILNMENIYEDETILLVSHGNVLQILQSLFEVAT